MKTCCVLVAVLMICEPNESMECRAILRTQTLWSVVALGIEPDNPGINTA